MNKRYKILLGFNILFTIMLLLFYFISRHSIDKSQIQKTELTPLQLSEFVATCQQPKNKSVLKNFIIDDYELRKSVRDTAYAFTDIFLSIALFGLFNIVMIIWANKNKQKL